MPTSLGDHSVSRDFELSKGLFGKRVSFTCKACDETVTTTVRKARDRAGAPFAAAICTECQTLSIFADKHGNYIRANR